MDNNNLLFFPNEIRTKLGIKVVRITRKNQFSSNLNFEINFYS
jgi:hypothetical protein